MGKLRKLKKKGARMKCPRCGSREPIKEGAVCRVCTYFFTLNPNRAPYISDNEFKLAVGRLSGLGIRYYTYNQLYAAIHRLARRNTRRRRIKGVVGLAIGLIAVTLLLRYHIDSGLGYAHWPSTLVFCIGFLGILGYAVRPIAVSHVSVVNAVSAFRTSNALEHLADGEHFSDSADVLIDEVVLYAPERVLIVERNDLADMLLLNRFHVENKTMVLSSYRYPTVAFKALQDILNRFPDIPVFLLHDASAEGIRMKERLQADPKWPLHGKGLHDLGLFPEEIKDIKRPVWIPSGRRNLVSGKKSVPAKSPSENIAQGFRMPVDVAPPPALLGTAGMALLTGYPLLSERMRHYRAQQGLAGDVFTPGYG